MELGESATAGGAAQGAEPGQYTGSGSGVTLRFVEIRGLYRPGFDDRAQRGTGRRIRCGYQVGYTSTGDRGRIFINHRPRASAAENWQRARAKDTQYIEARVRVHDPHGTLPGSAEIEWTWFDPDDPSDSRLHPAAARFIDTNAAGPADNEGRCDYPTPGANRRPQYQAEPGFPISGLRGGFCRTPIVGGQSRIRLHLSNIAGDNYRLRARIMGGPTPEPTAQTGLMTMWKRIDVEYRRMVGVLPVPVNAVAAAFEAAFIELDFTASRRIPRRRAMARGEDLHTPARRLVNANFHNRHRPGWFLLLAADQETSAHSSSPAQVVYPTPPATRGPGQLRVGTGNIQYLELPVDLGRAAVTSVKLYEGNRYLTLRDFGATLQNQPSLGRTLVEIEPATYNAEPTAGDGSALHAVSSRRRYLPIAQGQHEGLGFSTNVQCVVEVGYTIGAAGITPLDPPNDSGYFTGSSIVFMGKFRNSRHSLATVVHELCHAFGFGHDCGAHSALAGSRNGCAMATMNRWLYRRGTLQLERWSAAPRATEFCERHLWGLREVHLEDNPQIWRW